MKLVSQLVLVLILFAQALSATSVRNESLKVKGEGISHAMVRAGCSLSQLKPEMQRNNIKVSDLHHLPFGKKLVFGSNCNKQADLETYIASLQIMVADGGRRFKSELELAQKKLNQSKDSSAVNKTAAEVEPVEADVRRSAMPIWLAVLLVLLAAGIGVVATAHYYAKRIPSDESDPNTITFPRFIRRKIDGKFYEFALYQVLRDQSDILDPRYHCPECSENNLKSENFERHVHEVHLGGSPNVTIRHQDEDVA